MPTPYATRAGTPARPDHSLTPGRRPSTRLLCSLMLMGTFSLGLGVLSASAQDTLRWDFYPFAQPDGDFYSFEVSDLDVYNLDVIDSGAGVRIAPGDGSDDVLEIRGLSPNSSGVVTPNIIGYGSRVGGQATFGVPFDGNTPNLDGLVRDTFGGIQINDIGTDHFAIGAAFFDPLGTTVVCGTEQGVQEQRFVPDVFTVEMRVDRGVDDFFGQPHDGAGVRFRPAGSDDDFIILCDRYRQISEDGSNPVLPH